LPALLLGEMWEGRRCKSIFCKVPGPLGCSLVGDGCHARASLEKKRTMVTEKINYCNDHQFQREHKPEGVNTQQKKKEKKNTQSVFLLLAKYRQMAKKIQEC
jgi:hypothetical protein